MDPITEIIMLEDSRKKIIKLKQKISKWESQKKKCPSKYDEVLCISRLNQMIQDARNRIKKLQAVKEDYQYIEERMPIFPFLVTVIGTKWALRAMTKSGIDPTVQVVVGGTVVAGMIAWAAHAIYRDWMSSASKVCKKQTSSMQKKNDCIDKYRKVGKRKKKEMIEKGMKGCSRTKSPEKCKAKLKLIAAKL